MQAVDKHHAFFKIILKLFLNKACTICYNMVRYSQTKYALVFFTDKGKLDESRGRKAKGSSLEIR